MGRVKLQPIVLKRGMFLQSDRGYADTALWDWLPAWSRRAADPALQRHVVGMQPGAAPAVAAWAFVRGLPAKISGPALNAKTGEIAIEELHIVHEGLRLGPNR